MTLTWCVAVSVDALRPDVANVTRGSAAAQRKDADVKENLYNTPSIQTPPMKTFYNKSTVGPYATTTLIAGNNMLNKADSAFRCKCVQKRKFCTRWFSPKFLASIQRPNHSSDSS